jgi:ATP-binding cassette subfamily B protein
MMERLPALAVWICQVLIVGVGSVYAYRGGLSVGTLVSFNALFLNVSSGLTGIMQLMPALLRAEAGAARVAELLAEPVGVRDRPGASELAPRQTVLEFRDIGFSYGEGRPAVSGLCLHIAERETVAVVGPSGSGKSTLVNLLLRFYDPQQGAVLFDGADLRDVTQESLRRQLALVPQENFLFDTTLRENIRLGRPEASDADVEEAARDAEIHDFIMTLPQGYEAPAGERGGRLSGGQRQRIAIARALLRRPRVLLLDEATSALDATAEAAVNATLRRLSVERTVVSVTHRLASVVHADRIVVMNEGRMVETGTHSELMARQGVYAGLFSKQNAFSVDPSLNRAWIDPRWLRQLAFFADLDDAQLEALASEFTPEEYLAGRSIIEQNAAGERFYILARGTVEVVRDERQVARLQDGDFFGEIALIRDEPRTATVRTVTPCLALSLARGRFLTLFGDSPGFRQAVAARLAKVDLADQSG